MRDLLNLRQIDAFRAVMLTGTMVGAAKVLHVTQPAVSRLVSDLEDRIGFALFERRGRRLVATNEAEAFFREIEQAWIGLERITQTAADIRHGRGGALRVASLPAFASWFVPAVAARFLAARPRVSMYLHGLPSHTIKELVATSQYDVGVVELPAENPALRVQPLKPMPVVAVLPTGHRLARRSEVSLRSLAAETFISLSHQSLMRYRIEGMLTEAGVTPRTRVETPLTGIACALVAAGAGVSLSTPVPALGFLGQGVVIRPLTERVTTEFGVVFPAHRTPSALARAFADEVAAAAAAMVDEAGWQKRAGASLAAMAWRAATGEVGGEGGPAEAGGPPPRGPTREGRG